jgi:ppGpp synthetase/RelA/SpoT-type nucleotidyltranferase
MTTLEDFRQQLIDRRPELEAWGRYVLQYVIEKIPPGAVSLQITATRAKEVESAIGKIARKGYAAPLEQMTDLVGVRLVVLISPQIETIASIIESCPTWIASLDRDSNEEIEAAPERFDYQSKHYVVRNREPLELEGLVIATGLSCEIQIRTIMQHAYAEITHDSIYKPSAGKIPPKARRFVASSMALIETADHLFCETMQILEKANRPRNQLWKGLVDLYDANFSDVGLGYDDKLNIEVIDGLEAFQPDTALQEIQNLFDHRDVLLTKIRSRIPTDPFWSQPTVLLAYWLVQKDSMHAFDAWPFASAHNALLSVYADLGESPPHH